MFLCPNEDTDSLKSPKRQNLRDSLDKTGREAERKKKGGGEGKRIKGRLMCWPIKKNE